jgi:hypothetical protein
MLTAFIYSWTYRAISLVIEGANIISMTKEQIDTGKPVVIQGGKIVSIINRSETFTQRAKN